MRLEVLVALEDDAHACSVVDALHRVGHHVRISDPEGLPRAVDGDVDVVVSDRPLAPPVQGARPLVVSGPWSDWSAVCRLERLVEGGLPLPPRLALEDGLLDVEEGVVYREDATLRLTPTELDLVRALALRGVTSEEELRRRVWGAVPGSMSRVVRTTVGRVRKKLEADPSSPVNLVTRHGHGYELLAQPLDEQSRCRAESNVIPLQEPLFGRRALLDELDEARRAGARVITLVGPPGVGKSRVAHAHANRVRYTGRGAVWFCDLSGQTTLAGLCRSVEAVCGCATGARSAEQALVRIVARLEADPTALVVLDDADPVLPGAARAAALLAKSTVVLCTSRRPLGVPGERVIRVPPLPEGAAVAMLADRMGAAGPGGPVEASDPVLQDLARTLGGLPLALALVARHAAVLDPGEILARCRRSVDLLAVDDRAWREHQVSFADAIQWSWELLSGAEREVLAACAAFDVPFELELVARVAGRDDREVERIVRRLIEGNLVRPTLARERSATRRFQVYDLARRHIRGALASEALPDLESRWVDALADAAARWLQAADGPDHARCRDRLRALLPELKRAVARAGSEIAARLVPIVMDVYERWGPFDEGLAWWESVGPLDTPAPTIDVCRASLLWSVGRRAEGEPLARRATRDLEARGDLAGAAEALCLACAMARSDDGLDHALDLARRSGNRLAEAEVQTERAKHALRRRGDRDTARVLQEAVETFRAADSTRRLVWALDYLALCRVHLGELDAAAEALERVGALLEQMGNPSTTATRGALLGAVEALRGAPREALLRFHQAEEIDRRLGSRYFAVRMGCYQALAYLQMGDLRRAGDRLDTEVERARDVENRAWAGALHAVVLARKGRLCEAQDALAEGARHAAKASERVQRTVTLCGGLVAIETAAPGEALERARAVLDAGTWTPENQMTARLLEARLTS